MSYEAFVLTESSRRRLAVAFPPKNPLWIGHHVTHRFGVSPTPNVPYGQQTHGFFDVVGYSKIDGLEALVVRVVNRLTRPDGQTYHITWSLDPQKRYKPKDSNMMIMLHPWVVIDPIQFDATFDYIA